MMNTTGKNAAIVGIGLLGSSLGMALKNSGYLRSGWTRRPAVTQWALEHDVIDRGYSTPEEVFSEADILSSVCRFRRSSNMRNVIPAS